MGNPTYCYQQIVTKYLLSNKDHLSSDEVKKLKGEYFLSEDELEDLLRKVDEPDVMKAFWLGYIYSKLSFNWCNDMFNAGLAVPTYVEEFFGVGERMTTMSKYLQDMIEKSHVYDDLIVHTKGFAFDSLVFRFKEYQAKAFQAEVVDYKYKHNISEIEARMKVQDRHNRDLMRFIEILDGVIGEHD